MLGLVFTVLIGLSSPAHATDYAALFDEQAVLAEVQAQVPYRHQLLMELAETDRNEYYHQLYNAASVLFVDGDPRRREDFIDVWELRGLLDELAVEYVNTPPKERVALRAEMSEIAREIVQLDHDLATSRVNAAALAVERGKRFLRKLEQNGQRIAEREVKKSLEKYGF